MAIVTNIQNVKRFVGKGFCRKNMSEFKKLAHRQYRRCAKQAYNCDKEINEKPRLTPWDII